MIYFIHGDSKKSFEKANALVDSMLKKKPDSEVFKMNSDNFSEDKLSELIGGQSLFTKKYIIQMSHVLDDKNVSSVIMDNLKEIADSENIFIWVESEVKKTDLNKIEKKAEKVQEISSSKKQITSNFNVFSITDAFGERDKKKMWTLYLEAIKFAPPEEIHGILWWQLKSILLASKTNTAKEAGMKDFPYKKSKKYLNNFTSEELQQLSDKMIGIYHESRRGGADLSIRLEKFLLEI